VNSTYFYYFAAEFFGLYEKILRAAEFSVVLAEIICQEMATLKEKSGLATRILMYDCFALCMVTQPINLQSILHVVNCFLFIFKKA
jgi:hypothetical protein